MFFLRTHWDTSEFLHDKSLTNFRNNLLHQMINLLLEVNVRDTDIYSGCPMKCSLMVFILAVFIRHGLSNLHTATHATTPIILICKAITIIRRKSYERRWRKMRVIIRLVQLLRASWQLNKSQILYEKRVVNMFLNHVLPGILYHHLTHNIRWFGYEVDARDWERTRRTIRYA